MDPRKSRRLISAICPSCLTRMRSLHTRRTFSTSSLLKATNDHDGTQAFADVLRAATRVNIGPRRQQQGSSSDADSLPDGPLKPSQYLEDIASVARNELASKPVAAAGISDSHHLHVYATKHNTHITLTKPNREPLLSLSAGNIGFRKSQRGSFDAAYQLASFSMGKMHEKGMLLGMEKLEVVLRGFGSGREAFQKALLGPEGRGIKGKVTRVTDSTRLKFGGTRSKKVRRL